MEKAIWKQAANSSFWEIYARWYEQWLDHCSYHNRIIHRVNSIARPGWQVLDVGAGSGVLSVPMSRRGCHVTVLEPSQNMRRHLYTKLRTVEDKNLGVDKRPWEAVPTQSYRQYDLIVACNSLHVVPLGFAEALRKVFCHEPAHVLVVTEFVSPQIKVPLIHANYEINGIEVEKVKSSFAYHNLAEAAFHWSVQNGRSPRAEDVEMIRSKLVRKQNHLWLEDEVWLGIYHWKRKRGVSC